MNQTSKRYKIALIFFYISLAFFVLSLVVVYSSSNESGEFVPSMRSITRFFFHWIILPICFLLSIVGCSLAAAAKGRIQHKRFILAFLLNLSMILSYGGYLWAYHSGFIYHTFEMNPRARMEYAVDQNKLWMVKWELMRGANVDRKYWYNETLLIRAVRDQNKKLLHIVLHYHPDVNKYGELPGVSLTPLHCVTGVESDFSSNIIRGIALGKKNKNNLSSEVLTKRIGTLHQLRNQTPNDSRGAGIMALAPQKQQPAPASKDWDLLEAARLLMEHGASPDLRLKSLDPKQSYNDITALSLAYDNSKSDLVDLLLSHGADVNVKIRYQEQTLLHAAVDQGDVEMIKRLVALGAELDAKDKDTLNGPKSPLQMAVAFEEIECARVLIENGANVNLMFSEGIGGNSPLHLAAMTGNMKIVQLLLNHGADVNATEINGKTPLHLAVDFSRDKTEIVELLLEHSADPDVIAVFSDRRGETENHTPLSLAQKKQYSAVADVLSSYSAKISP
jgi:ankyrin repeat protein